MSAHKKLKGILGIIALGGILIVLGTDSLSILGIPSAHAQFNIGMDAATRNNLQSVMALLIATLNWLTFVVFALLQFLLDPRIIFDIGGNVDGMGLEGMLNSIW